MTGSPIAPIPPSLARAANMMRHRPSLTAPLPSGDAGIKEPRSRRWLVIAVASVGLLGGVMLDQCSPEPVAVRMGERL